VSLPDEPLMLTMAETAELLRVSLRQIKTMVADGSLASVKLGRRRLVPYEVLRRSVLEAAGLKPGA
jgi:excisionase family DNA binding protein